MGLDATRTTSASTDARGDRVSLVVPPSSEFLRTVRLVAADAAVRIGCDHDDVEDFRIAIDELCHLLMTSTDHFVHLSVNTFDAHVVANGAARARSVAGEFALEPVSELIVASTTDEHRVEHAGGDVTFVAVKRARRVPSDVASDLGAR